MKLSQKGISKTRRQKNWKKPKSHFGLIILLFQAAITWFSVKCISVKLSKTSSIESARVLARTRTLKFAWPIPSIRKAKTNIKEKEQYWKRVRNVETKESDIIQRPSEIRFLFIQNADQKANESYK